MESLLQTTCFSLAHLKAGLSIRAAPALSSWALPAVLPLHLSLLLPNGLKHGLPAGSEGSSSELMLLCQHRPLSARRWHQHGAAGAKLGWFKHFLQHLVSFAIDVWVALLVKIVTRESFNLNSQTGTHAQKKNDLEKNPPNSFRLPCSVKWK